MSVSPDMSHSSLNQTPSAPVTSPAEQLGEHAVRSSSPLHRGLKLLQPQLIKLEGTCGHGTKRTGVCRTHVFGGQTQSFLSLCNYCSLHSKENLCSLSWTPGAQIFPAALLLCLEIILFDYLNFAKISEIHLNWISMLILCTCIQL